MQVALVVAGWLRRLADEKIMPRTFVNDNETLYRRVPYGKNLYVVQSDSSIRFSSQAFSDPRYRPSVDRAELCHHNPTHTQLKPSDGVISLVTHDVRSIEGIVQNDQNGNALQSFDVDVEHVPVVNDPVLPDNDAHAEIYTIPVCPNKNIFRKLSEKLALLASKRQWEIEPCDPQEFS